MRTKVRLEGFPYVNDAKRSMKNYPAAFILLAGVLSLLSLITGCDLTGSSNAGLSGNIIGYAALHDLNGFTVQEDTGITVSVEGKVYTTTTNTDSAGEWEISGLTGGTYNVTVSKPGYGARKILDFQFVGGGQANTGTVTLYQIPLDSATRLSDSLGGGSLFLNGAFSGSLPAAAGYARVYVFLGKSTAVSSDPQNYLSYVSGGNSGSDSAFSAAVYNDTTFLLNAGFTAGETVYAVAYGGSVGPVGYTDSTTNRSVFTGLNPTPSNIDSFVAP